MSRNIAPNALFYFRWGAAFTVLTGAILAWLNGYIVEALTFREGFRLIGTGMWLALIMAFNVWFIIWPNQQKALGLVEADDATKAKSARTAMLTSRVSALSIPMLYAMTTFQSLPAAAIAHLIASEILFRQRPFRLEFACPPKIRVGRVEIAQILMGETACEISERLAPRGWRLMPSSSSGRASRPLPWRSRRKPLWSHASGNESLTRKAASKSASAFALLPRIMQDPAVDERRRPVEACSAILLERTRAALD